MDEEQDNVEALKAEQALLEEEYQRLISESRASSHSINPTMNGLSPRADDEENIMETSFTSAGSHVTIESVEDTSRLRRRNTELLSTLEELQQAHEIALQALDEAESRKSEHAISVAEQSAHDTVTTAMAQQEMEERLLQFQDDVIQLRREHKAELEEVERLAKLEADVALSEVRTELKLLSDENERLGKSEVALKHEAQKLKTQVSELLRSKSPHLGSSLGSSLRSPHGSRSTTPSKGRIAVDQEEIRTLTATIKSLEEENHWLQRCLSSARDKSVQPNERSNTTFTGQGRWTEQRAQDRRDKEEMAAILDYLAQHGMKPEANGWQHLRCLWKELQIAESSQKELTKENRGMGQDIENMKQLLEVCQSEHSSSAVRTARANAKAAEDKALKLDRELLTLRSQHERQIAERVAVANQLHSNIESLKAQLSDRDRALRRVSMDGEGRVQDITQRLNSLQHESTLTKIQLDETKELASEERERLYEELEQATTNAREQIASLRDTHRAEVEQIMQQHEHTISLLEGERDNLRDEVEHLHTTYTEKLNDMENQHALEKDTQEEMIDSLRNLVEDKELRHDEEVRRLQTALATAEDNMTAVTDSADQKHQELIDFKKQFELELDRLQDVLQNQEETHTRETEEILQTREEKIRALMDRTTAMTNDLKESRKQVDSLATDLMKAQSANVELEEEINDLLVDKESMLQQQNATEQRIKTLDSALQAKEEEIAAARDVFKRERTALNESLRRVAVDSNLLGEEAELLRKARSEEVTTLNQDKATLGSKLEEACQTMELLHRSLEQKTAELEAVYAEFDSERANMTSTLQREKMESMAQRERERQEWLQQDQAKLAQVRQYVSDHQSAQMALKEREVELTKLKEEQSSTAANLESANRALQMAKENVGFYFNSFAAKAPHRNPPLGAASSSQQLGFMLDAFEQQLSETMSLKERLSNQQAMNQEGDARLAEFRNDLNKSKQEASRLTEDLNREKESTAALKTKVQFFEEKVSATESEMRLLRNRLSQATEQIAETNAAATENQNQVQQVLESVREGFNVEKENFLARLTDLEDQIEKERQNTADAVEKAKRMERSFEEAQLQCTVATSGKENTQAALNLKEHQLSQLQSEISTMRNDLAKSVTKQTELELKNATLEASVDQTETYLRATRESLEAEQAAHSKLQDQFIILKEEYNVQIGSNANARSATEAELIKLQAQLAREQRVSELTIADLKRQLEVLSSRATRKTEALSASDATCKQLREENLRLNHLAEKLRKGDNTNDIQNQLTHLMRTHDREMNILRLENSKLATENARLHGRQQVLEESTRATSSRALEESRRDLQFRQSALNNLLRGDAPQGRESTRKISHLNSQVKRLQSDLRQTQTFGTPLRMSKLETDEGTQTPQATQF